MQYRKIMLAAAAAGALTLSACSSGGDADPAPTNADGDVDYTGQTLTVMHYEGEDSDCEQPSEQHG